MELLINDIAQAREDYARVKAGLVTGISIGYETVRENTTRDGVRELHEIRLWEVSLVTFPANADARVTAVKRRDDTAAALAGLARLNCELRQLGALISMRTATLSLRASAFTTAASTSSSRPTLKGSIGIQEFCRQAEIGRAPD